jgi:hypothetical protein
MIAGQVSVTGRSWPVLAFSVGSRPPGLALRVNFSLEAAPPWIRGNERLAWGYAVDLPLAPAELEQAADEWSQNLDNLAARSEVMKNPPEGPQAPAGMGACLWLR